MAYELTVVMRFESEDDTPTDTDIEEAFDCIVVSTDGEEV